MKKIDIFYNGKYMCSTTQSKACWRARQKYLINLDWKKDKTILDRQILNRADLVKAYFDKNYKK